MEMTQIAMNIKKRRVVVKKKMKKRWKRPKTRKIKSKKKRRVMTLLSGRLAGQMMKSRLAKLSMILTKVKRIHQMRVQV